MVSAKRLAMLGAALVSACGDPASPRYTAPASLHVVSGDEVTDTVTQWLAQPLVLEVRDSAGAAIPRAIVRFDPIYATIPLSPFAGLIAGVEVSPPDSSVARGFLAAVADGKGRVIVKARLGRAAGRVGVAVSAPEGGVADTVWFTALPDRPYDVSFVNGDTTVVTGGTLEARLVVVDPHANLRTDAPTLSVGGTMVSIDAQGVARAGAPGRGFVAARVQDVVDTMRVAVVPAATIAVIEQVIHDAAAITVLRLDGLQQRRVLMTRDFVRLPAWNPAGTEIAYYELPPTHGVSDRMFIVNMAGERRPVLPVMPSGLRAASMPRFSPDGEWLYFTGHAPFPHDPDGLETSPETWRVRRDGSSAARLLPDPPDWETVAWQADASPDGARLALSFNGVISLYELATGTLTPLGVRGEMPRFSPSGDAIAYISIEPGLVGPIYIVRTDGTGARPLTPGRVYDQWAGYSWSPDGQWIIVGTSPLELVRVATGEVMRLPYSRAMRQAAFRP